VGVLSQVLDSDKSLQNAVSRVIAWLAETGVAMDWIREDILKQEFDLREGLLNRLLSKTAQKPGTKPNHKTYGVEGM